jgi:UDP-glucose 4-epimerase
MELEVFIDSLLESKRKAVRWPTSPLGAGHPKMGEGDIHVVFQTVYGLVRVCLRYFNAFGAR